MSIREQDNLPYRSSITPANQAQQSTARNEDNYDTLKIVRGILSDGIDGLHKDFNAFDVLANEDKEKAARNLLRQIDGKQMAYDILMPLLEAVDSAVKRVDSKHRGK